MIRQNLDHNQLLQSYHYGVCQININGLSSHCMTALSKFIHQHSISILALQETKVVTGTVRIDQFHGMSTFIQSNGLGVGLSLSNNLKPQVLNQLSDDESSILWATVNINNSTTLVASAYCTPESTSTRSLYILLSNVRRAKDFAGQHGIENILVLGDFKK